MSQAAIEVCGLSKRYSLGAQQPVLRRLANAARRRLGGDESAPDDFWALRDVSFSVEPGEVVGIIGRNGAGKSTLLKILSQITTPTSGYAKVRGRMGSLLEVGTGFHPELTGRENIYLNGAILGMRRREITRQIDAIIDFSGVEQFLDTPVKRYSSGMRVRLAFAVAAHLEPEVLVVDEVLAVGDAAFQEKCLGKMKDLATGHSRTVLFVSHHMAAVESLCDRAVLLEGGSVAAIGPCRDVIPRYLDQTRQIATQPLAQRTDREGSGALRFTNVVLETDDGGPMRCGEPVTLRIAYESDAEQLPCVHVSAALYGNAGQCLVMMSNEMVGESWPMLPGRGEVTCRVPQLALAPGFYTLNLHGTVNGLVADWVRHAATVPVEAGDYFGTGRLPPAAHGVFLVPQQWSRCA